jgi:hypothetical protein
MKKVVTRERNKTYYRMLHLPIWIWVFFILPGNLTYAFYLHGPDRRHWIWLSVVAAVCIWRGIAGRLPGVEPAPYITHYGADQPNLSYRVVCYTAAWIDLIAPFTLNLFGLLGTVLTGRWLIREFYLWLYWPIALAVVAATIFDLTPRARRSTKNEGAERAWFYVAIWTVVPSQLAGWAMWRLGPRLGLAGRELDLARLAAFASVAAFFIFLGAVGRLGRTDRYYDAEVQNEDAATAEAAS